MTRHRSESTGAALIITLWALVLLAVIAAGFTFSVRMGSASARNFKEDMKAYYAAVSAYEEARAWLLEDEDQTIDYVDEEGFLHTDEDRDPIAGERELEGMKINLAVTDEESRININLASPTLLKNLLVHIKIPDNKQQELMDSFIDWEDPDDLHRLSGAEDEYYVPLGYKTKNHLLDIPEELLLIKGFAPEILYGSDDNDPLIDYITTWGTGLNINTISPGMMESIGMNPFEVDSILAARRNGTVTRTAPEDMRRLGGAVSSTTFRIVASARYENSPNAVKVTAIVSRVFGTNGPEISTLYWKEELEHSGA
jgi:general secretion pathway protein K